MSTRRTSIALYRALLRAGRSVRLSDKTKHGLIFTPAQAHLTSLEAYQLSSADAVRWGSYGLGAVKQLQHWSDTTGSVDDSDSHSGSDSGSDSGGENSNDNSDVHIIGNETDNEDSEVSDRENSSGSGSGSDSGSDSGTKYTYALLTGNHIEALVKKNFKDTILQPHDEHEINERLDLGFKGLSCLSLVTKQSARSSLHISTKGSRVSIRIIVTAFYHTQHLSTQEHNYHYRIQVENIGQGSVQLCGRHWEFRNSKGEEESVVPKYAQGVVGETPVLPPGEGIQYMSQCFLSTDEGCMRGTFLFSDLDNEELFEATVGR